MNKFCVVWAILKVCVLELRCKLKKETADSVFFWRNSTQSPDKRFRFCMLQTNKQKKHTVYSYQLMLKTSDERYRFQWLTEVRRWFPNRKGSCLKIIIKFLIQAAPIYLHFILVHRLQVQVYCILKLTDKYMFRVFNVFDDNCTVFGNIFAIVAEGLRFNSS